MQRGSVLMPVVLIILTLSLFLGGVIYFRYNFVSVPSPLPSPEGVACTQDAKQCPNGSYVGREGPNCEFKTCSSN